MKTAGIQVAAMFAFVAFGLFASPARAQVNGYDPFTPYNGQYNDFSSAIFPLYGTTPGGAYLQGAPVAGRRNSYQSFVDGLYDDDGSDLGMGRRGAGGVDHSVAQGRAASRYRGDDRREDKASQAAAATQKSIQDKQRLLMRETDPRAKARIQGDIDRLQKQLSRELEVGRRGSPAPKSVARGRTAAPASGSGASNRRGAAPATNPRSSTNPRAAGSGSNNRTSTGTAGAARSAAPRTSTPPSTAGAANRSASPAATESRPGGAVKPNSAANGSSTGTSSTKPAGSAKPDSARSNNSTKEPKAKKSAETPSELLEKSLKSD